ncbi:MAG: hypothetical protein M1148_03145 [Candidatus Thermoplasmatota archaeon]|nr:hypothetical protein [Candidatus Thermoplasmatota archaeon]MCL5438175.1 hypothetical protein [Candidatus Thermoplasmatota archaeon]
MTDAFIFGSKSLNFLITKLILDFGGSNFLIKFVEKRMKDVCEFTVKNNVLPLILYRIPGETSMRRG